MLTTSANIGGYIDGTEAKAEQLKRGLKTLTDAIKNGRLNLKMLEEPALSYFKDTNAQMAKKFSLRSLEISLKQDSRFHQKELCLCKR